MKTPFPRRETALALVALAGITAIPFSLAHAADRADTKASGTYVTGDFHNHTTCSDGALSVQKLVDKSARTFGLDWFVQADHGGSSTRNCTLAEDPFEPVHRAGPDQQRDRPVPAQHLPQRRPARQHGQGPQQTWEATLPNGRAASRVTAPPRPRRCGAGRKSRNSSTR
jgi:hypothetical protein